MGGIHHQPILEGFAEIKTYAKEQGRTIGDNDIWIAATARATGACLLTTDRDFDFLHGRHIRREWIVPKDLIGPPTVAEQVVAYPADAPGGLPTGSPSST